MILKLTFLHALFISSIFAACSRNQTVEVFRNAPANDKGSAIAAGLALIVEGLPPPVSNARKLSLLLATKSLPLQARDARVRFLVADGASSTCDSRGKSSEWVAVGARALVDLTEDVEDGNKLLCIQTLAKNNSPIPNKYEFRWIKDTLSPTLAFREAPAARFSSASLTLQLSSSESSVRYAFLRETTPQSLTAAECNSTVLEDFGSAWKALSEPLEVSELAISGDTAICVKGMDPAGNLSPALYAMFRHGNQPPPAPTLVSLAPSSPTKSSTLTCASTAGGADADGDAVSPIFYWYRNGSLIAGATTSTLAMNSNVSFVKGDGFRCDVAVGDGTALTAPVASGVVTLLNGTPASPSSVTVSAATPTKEGSFSCGYTGGSDVDGDTLSPTYAWAVEGSVIFGQTSSTLLGSVAAVVKSKVVTCAVSLSDGIATSSATSSAGTTVLNSPLAGTVSCTGAVPHAIGKTGDSYSIACGGAADPDGASDITYQLEAVTGTCPSIAANGTLAGTFPAAGNCDYRVKACDSAGCTALSSAYKFSSYALTASLAAPSLSSDCTLSLTGTSTPSSNLANFTYSGSTGLSGTAVNSSGLSLVLAQGTHSAGSYQASWGVTSADIFGLSASTSVAASASPVNFALTLSDPTAWALRSPAATFVGNVQVGRQVPVASPGASKCVSNASGNYAMIAAGQDHTCALTSSGAVKCWGKNSAGQLGDNSTTQRNSPVDVSGLSSGVTAIATGTLHTCALTSAGAVKCWGDNYEGQLGDNSTTQRNSLVDVIDLSSGVTAISAGDLHTCALTSAGAVKCWGTNTSGELGNNSTTRSLVPVTVSNLSSGVEAIAAGFSHTCALTNVGAVKCWGTNTSGELGNNSTTQSLSPVDVSGLSSGVVAIAAGYLHTCAVTSAGAVKCWGRNTGGQLGDNSATQRNAPVDVSGLSSNVTAIAAGGFHTCALTTAGAVKCWGSNFYSQLGDNSATQRNAPADVSGLSSGVVALTTGNNHTCAVTSAGAVKCWGSNSDGQLGDNISTQRWTPTDVSGLSSGVSALAAGVVHTCASTSAGAAKCWGANANGQLGDGSTTKRNTPADVSGLSSGVVALTAGYLHTCALTSAGAVHCWGKGDNGQLGDGSATESRTPVSVNGLSSDVSAIAAGGNQSCALTSAGAVKCWGANGLGQLGDSSTTQRNTPVDVSGLSSGVAAITIGFYHTCALTNAGAVKCWGSNTSGELGDNSTANRNAPVDVSGLSSGVSAIAAGGNHTCAFTSAGAAKCWGYNAFGQLGDNSTTQRNTPVDVSGLSSGVTSISGGLYHTCAFISAGGVKCWGYNSHGQLGNSSVSDPLSILDVFGLTGIGLIQKIFSL